MHYTIYKVTNLINRKFYIGKHQTQDLNDGYMGSGKYIKRAIKKHGKENFKKEILFVFDNEAEMNAKEAELVVICDESYNLCDGGQGGFGYINRIGKNIRDSEVYTNNGTIYGPIGNEKRKWLWENDLEWKMKYSKTMSESSKGKQNFLGKKHTEEKKKKHSDYMKGRFIGNENSQYGTFWITNGTENKKIKAIDNIPEGWYKGRKMK